MDGRTAFYFAQGLATSSLKMYQAAVNCYIKYCQNSNNVCVSVSEVVLCGFVSSLADEGLKHCTIKTYLSGMCYYQIKSGYADPFRGVLLPRLDYVMRGMKRPPSEDPYTSLDHFFHTVPVKKGVVFVRREDGHKDVMVGLLYMLFWFSKSRRNDGTWRQRV